MNIEIFGQENTDILRVKLKATHDGVSLVAVDAEGVAISGGSIVSLNSDGLTVHSYVNSSLQLPREGNGHVATRKEGI